MSPPYKNKFAKYRENQSKEAGDLRRERDRTKKKQKRSEISAEERAEQLKIRREKYAQKVAERKESERKEKMRNSYKWNEEHHNKERIKKKRKERSIEEVELDCVEQLIRRRKEREERDDDQHLQDNLKAKEGMRELKTMSRIMPYKKRYFYKMTEIEIWKIFRDLGPTYRELLEQRRPDVVKRLEDMEDEEKKLLQDQRKKAEEEMKRSEKEEREKEEKIKVAIEKALKDGKTGTGINEGYVCIDGVWHWAGNPDDDPEKPKGEWVYLPIDDEYYWSGEGDPPTEDHFSYNDTNQGSWKVTEEDEKRWKEEDEKLLKYEMEKIREERKAYMKNYHKKKKEELLKPIILDQKGEKSKYEELRESNLKEFERLKKESGLFDD